MTGFLVSASTGTMNSLLCKLTKLLGDEYKLLKGVRKEIAILKDELSSMNSLLQMLADIGELDIQRKEWKDKVRELAYDIEDCMDIFMHRLHPRDEKDGSIHKMVQKIKQLRSRHQIAVQIQELKSRVMEESSRRDRYKIDVPTSYDRLIRIDPRLPALYAEARSLVGMESPRDEIIQRMMDHECQSCLLEKLKVVSIAGFGGLGKTTLANQVYCEIKENFQCTAFVSISQNPNLCEILDDMLSQIMGSARVGVLLDQQKLIDKIRAYLRDKRYLVVVDDIWSIQVWDIIKCAFVEDNNGSRVITTTRIEQVARECCSYYHGSIYKMKPLNDIDSRKLFFKRIFGSENGCPEQYKDVSQNILKKCGGVPLAIISIASLLANQEYMHKEKWENIQKSLVFEMETSPTFECLRHVLNLSYNDLSHSLKTCFLYLGIYPEDYKIEKAYLLRRWIAEGFVSHQHGLSPEEVAESYFNDLLNRSMIQPAGFEYTELTYCQVHDLMLDFILSKSIEENFITIMDDQHCNKGTFKVRRLCLQSKNANIAAANTSVSQIRSFTVFQYSGRMPSFSSFGLLRVMDLYMDYFDRSECLDLSAISKLFQLRFLRCNSHEIKLPRKIWGLKHLETLDIRDATVTNIPSDLPLLRSLQHLTIPDNVRLPNGIGKLSALHTLGFFNLAENSIDNIRDIGKLTNLRELDLIWTKHVVKAQDPTEKLKRKFLTESLGKLSNLRSFYVSSIDTTKLVSPTCDFLSCWFPTPLNLQRLSLCYCKISKLPEWISQLSELTSLKIRVNEMMRDDVEVLGQLPCLVYLDLSVKKTKQDLIFHSDEYPNLREFGFHYCVSSHNVTFEPRTMPKLQVLHLGICKLHQQGSGSLAGIEHLLSVEKLKARIYCPELMGLAFRDAILRHPRSHTFKILFPRC
uniref:AAA+ ATPase domain-containing protein n=1 Tax=Leersia perrieri TaxID=77586 RepID=A0A0D9XZ63_9ORYZ